MIELDKKDVKAIARSRLYRRKKWKFLMSAPFGALVVLFIVDWTTEVSNYWFVLAITAVAVYLLGLIIWYSRKEKKVEGELVREWKKKEEGE